MTDVMVAIEPISMGHVRFWPGEEVKGIAPLKMAKLIRIGAVGQGKAKVASSKAAPLEDVQVVDDVQDEEQDPHSVYRAMTKSMLASKIREAGGLEDDTPTAFTRLLNRPKGELVETLVELTEDWEE